MIVYPEDWRKAGRFVTTTMIHYSLMRTIRNIPCRYLSYSGGLDSSLLLYHMLCTGRKVVTFTATCGEDHPDAQYSRIGIDYYQRLFGEDKLEAHWMVYSSTGDDLVKEHYKELAKYCDSIITGDGVDEYMAGYYCHQEVDVDKKEEVYIDRLRRLQAEHLEPLDSNSGPVKVYIPYLDEPAFAEGLLARLVKRAPDRLFEMGEPVATDLAKMPHLLIAGTTGSGKSVCINSIIGCLLMHNAPEDVRIVLIDPKRVELANFEHIPHLVFSKIIIELEEVVGTLQAVIHEME
ncbi:hypothetical protein LCGC14_0744770, partial [marine sediment metagenome]